MRDMRFSNTYIDRCRPSAGMARAVKRKLLVCGISWAISDFAVVRFRSHAVHTQAILERDLLEASS